MVPAIVSLAVIGALFGAILAFAAKKFAVEADPKVEAIRAALPGANCGACGFPGCAGLADAIAKGKAPVDRCPVGGANSANQIAAVMGVAAGTSGEAKVARLLCQGGRACLDQAVYAGPTTCVSANLTAGPKSCSYGCIGFGDCVKVCPFGAMTLGPDNLPAIDEAKCTGCGKCADACPKLLLKLVGRSKAVHVLCSSQDKGASKRKYCNISCIGCSICEKTCPFDAIHVKNNVASIDYDKCRSCGLCVAKCPTKVITLQPEKKQKAYVGSGCIGCTICAKNCPTQAIAGELKQHHTVDPEKCVGCGVCLEKCPKKIITWDDRASEHVAGR